MSVFEAKLTYKIPFNQNVTVLLTNKRKFPQYFINVSKRDRVSQNILHTRKVASPRATGLAGLVRSGMRIAGWASF